MRRIRVLLVDDHEAFRRVLRLLLELRDDLQIAGEAADGLEAVKKIKTVRPDLILLDVDLSRLNGIQVARRLQDLAPRAKILFLSVECSADVVREAFKAGGSGYINKLHIGSELLPAVAAILRGTEFIGRGIEYPPKRHEMLVYSDGAALVSRLDGHMRAQQCIDKTASS